MRQRNVDIRIKAKQADVKLWEIGEKLGMSDSTFSRFLRKEVDQNTKKRIFCIIQELQKDEMLQVACV